MTHVLTMNLCLPVNTTVSCSDMAELLVAIIIIINEMNYSQLPFPIILHSMQLGPPTYLVCRKYKTDFKS